jgi:ABC-type Mn2+/Zn2+ transport system ATPase subunit
MATERASAAVPLRAALEPDRLPARLALRGEHLTLGYGKRLIVRRLSFDVHTGDILGIVGPNGCGKTTLLRAILGLLKPLEGRVVREPGLIVSYVPQRDRRDTLLPFTVGEVVLMGRTAYSGALHRIRRTDRDAAQRAMATMGVEALGPQLFRSLSGGQQQRVLLARALAAEPDLLVLDEPTAGMDLASDAATLDILRQLNRTRRVTILVVTHLLSHVLNFATTVLLMDAGETIYGRIDDVLCEQRLSALYSVPVHIGRVANQRVLAVGSREISRV